MNTMKDYEKENIDIAKKLKEAGDELKIKDEVLYANKTRILNSLDVKKRTSHIKFVPAFAASLLLVVSLLATSVLAFPDIAKRVAPGIPLIKEISQKDEQLDKLSEQIQVISVDAADKEAQIEVLKNEIEELKIRIKEISEEKIKEVETSPNEDEAQNLLLQTLVVDFVKEMYRGNYEKAALYCTEEFARTVLNRPEDILMRSSSDAVVFTQITNVAKVDDSLFMVFLRLNDSGQEMEADHQLDFEIVRDGDEYKISFAGLNA